MPIVALFLKTNFIIGQKHLEQSMSKIATKVAQKHFSLQKQLNLKFKLYLYHKLTMSSNVSYNIV